MTKQLHEVTRDEFLATIFADGLDVHPTIVSRFPYTSEWRFHRQLGAPLYGMTIDMVEDGLIKTTYFRAKL
jgi:hypothetical protein